MNSNTVISMPSQLFTMRSSFKAVANGSVYIGEVDTDPTIPTNQIQVYIEQENGTLVPVAQPIKINSAGLLTASGQVQKFVLTNTEYSMTVQNSYGVDEFYFPRIYDQGISAALEVEERLLGPGAKLYRGSNGKYVKDGDVVPVGTTHISLLINGEPEDFIAWGFLTLPATIMTTPVSDNGFSGYDVLTNQGTFEFVDLSTKAKRDNGDFSGWGGSLSSANDQYAHLTRYAYESSKFEIPGNVVVYTSDGISILHANVDVEGELRPYPGSTFTTTEVLSIGAYNASVETTLSGTNDKGFGAISVSDTSNLAVGDVVVIYDPVDYSFALHRPYYRAGEMLLISEIVSSTQFKATNPLFDSYSSGLSVYKLNPTKGKIKNLNVHAEGYCMYAVTLESLAFTEVHGSKCSGGTVAAVHRNRCYQLDFFSPCNTQNYDDGSATNYAHYTLSCQNVVDHNPNVRAFRHALTLTARDQELSIPNRMCGAIGGQAATFGSSPGVTAADFHGCTENCFYLGMDLYGGVNIGGKNNRVKSKLYQQFQPSCLYGGEIVSFNHDYSECEIITSGAGNQSRGQWIDIGGNGPSLDANVIEGGTIDFRNIKVKSTVNPPLSAFTLRIVNRGYVGNDLRLNFDNFKAIIPTDHNNWVQGYVGLVDSGDLIEKVSIVNAEVETFALRIWANNIDVNNYSSKHSSNLAINYVGLEIYLGDGVLNCSASISDTSYSPLNVFGGVGTVNDGSAYFGNLHLVNGNKESGSTTEQNSGFALRELEEAYTPMLNVAGKSVNASAINAARSNTVTNLYKGIYSFTGYSNNSWSATIGNLNNYILDV